MVEEKEHEKVEKYQDLKRDWKNVRNTESASRANSNWSPLERY